MELCGLAAAYNVLSGDLGNFREVIAPGAFTRSLREEQDVKALVNHDSNRILGRTTSGTLQLSDSPEGLRFRCQLDPNQQSHRDIHSSIKRGDISMCSFAFRPHTDDGASYDQALDENGQRFHRRTLRDVDLFDISVVCDPAYAQGTSVQARSADYRFTVPQRRPVGDSWAAERAALAALDAKFATDRLKAKESAFQRAVQYREIKNARGEVIDFEPVTLADLGIKGVTVAEYLEDVVLRNKADKQLSEIRRQEWMED
jgi:HK97 family phage prohead protease